MITAKQLSEAFISGANNISNNRQKVDALNVFPVPDGDTGTNMSMTMGAAREDLLQNDYSTVGEVAGKAASALLRGARGNSGVITSLLFRGFSKGLKHKTEAGAADLVEALEIGVAAAYKAVMKPTEGTILTVARVAAEKSRAALTDAMTPAELWDLVVEATEEALKHTPEQLPILKKAGVVDAGGQGLVYIFKGMQQVFAGQGMVAGAVGTEAAREEGEAATVVNAAGEVEEVDINNPYCTEFLVMRDNPEHDPSGLRAYLESIGDCVVVVDDEEIIKCHVHTAHPGLALEKAATYGMLTKLKIENMIEQHKAQVAAVKQQQKPAAVPVDESLTAGFVAIAAGDGVQQLFTDLGVQQIVSGGQTMNPSTEDILHAVEQVPAMDVYVLPNNKNIVMAAEQAAKLARTNGSRRVHVVPTTTIPQGISAMMAYDENADLKANLEAMQAAAEQVQSGSVTFAARDSDYDGQLIREGELLALENGKVAFTGTDLGSVVAKVAKDLLRDDSQFVTLLYGAEVTEEQAAAVEESVRTLLPEELELTVAYGGQPVYYFLISVE
ncbi:MAG: DAK2 domain-containing protein [Angelakisella sp.]